MLLRRYFCCEYGLDVLRNFRIYACNPNTFNDPFELLPYFEKPTLQELRKRMSSSEFLDEFYRSYKKQVDSHFTKASFIKILPHIHDKYFCDDAIVSRNRKINTLKEGYSQWMRIISFSSTEVDSQTDILLWSHYANKHNGIRITFDIDKFPIPFRNETLLVPVIYQAKRVALKAYLAGLSKCLTKSESNSRLKILFVKSLAWAYEHEYRCLINLGSKHPIHFSIKNGNDSKEYIKCPPKAIVSVDIGCNVNETIINEIKALRNKNGFQHVSFNKCTMHTTEFKVDYTPL